MSAASKSKSSPDLAEARESVSACLNSIHTRRIMPLVLIKTVSLAQLTQARPLGVNSPRGIRQHTSANVQTYADVC
jgi:hypothetical protein